MFRFALKEREEIVSLFIEKNRLIVCSQRVYIVDNIILYGQSVAALFVVRC